MIPTFSAYSQNLETLSIVVSDQNGDLITIGFVLLTDANGKKIAEIKIGKTKTLKINLASGSYNLEIQSPGFKTYQKIIEIKKGQNNLEVQLELEDVKVNINVERSEREKRIDEVMGGYLSQKEIDALPESGEDIKEELQKRYGDDILIRIDGDFEGSQIPSRAEISSIKVIRNTFDAEFHEVGRIIIDIRTNTIAIGFHGFGSFNFNNSILNARNPFALKRQPQSANNFILVFSGPLIKKKTSFSVSTLRFGRTATQNFIGTGYNVRTIIPQKTESGIALTTFGIKHILSKNQTLNFKYLITNLNFKNLGLGAFDLPERGANRNNIQHKFSLIESGTFKGKYANDFTFDFTAGVEKVTPNSEDETILVLNAFNSGGAGAKNRTDRQRFRLADNLLFDTKKHSLKLGTEIIYEKLQNVSENNLNGTFTFLNLTDFNNGKPAQFSQTSDKTNYDLSQLRNAFYFQDYFKPDKAVQLSLGLRYEWQNDVRNNNFSPRFGYVWSPEKSGKFVVRGGIGVFYDWLDTQTLSAILSNGGRQGQKLIVVNPAFPNPFNGGIISRSLPPSISKLDNNLTTPSIFVTQNALNYKLNKAVTFEGIYTFRRGWHQFRSRNINAPLNGVRPNPNFGIIQLLESSGIIGEHSFELKVNGYYRGINMYANYQLAKNTADFFSPLSLPMDNYNLRLDRGLSNLDQTHKLNVSFNFDILKN
ncbi:MAG: PEGA domain-containing protein, partial [Pyrinomonadaceae bacterium]